MKQTLFVIPSEWFTSYVLWIWLAFSAFLICWNSRSKGLGKALSELLPFAVIIATIIFFVLPRLSVPQVNPQDPLGDYIPGGLAIRGYGVFLMLAIVIAVGMVVARCRQLGVAADNYVTLCFVMIVCGLAGARIFYVVQKWPEFQGRGFAELLTTIVDMTKGGMVVYGSLIGGLIGAGIYLLRKKMPILPSLDVLAPAMMLGLAIGRIGCLMNGCCFGGPSGEEFPFGIRFPPSSAPYHEQLSRGDLFGITGEWNDDATLPLRVTTIRPGSIGEQFGLKIGDEIRIPIIVEPDRLQFIIDNNSDVKIPVVIESKTSGPITRKIPAGDFPRKSLKIHPAQIYASVSAFLICGLLWFFYPFRKFDGQMISLLLISYAASRFVEEAIRVDEHGQFGTQLSISQWISIFTLVAGVLIYGFAKKQLTAVR